MRKSCQKAFIYLAVSTIIPAVAAWPSSGSAQLARDLKFASSPNPVGSGARAVGRGGAFIAIADDATAASWNPAGLVQLEFPETSIVLSNLARTESLEFGGDVVSSEDYHYSTRDLNYASLVYPTEALPVYVVFSINYQRLYEFDREVKFEFSGSRTAGPFLIDSAGSVDYEQTGAFTTISPALAVEINYRFSVGLAVNIWNNSLTPNGWDQRDFTSEAGTATVGLNTYPFTLQSEKEETYRLEGYNYNVNLGFLWDINDTWRVGGVYKTEFEADVRHKRDWFNGQFFPTFAGWTDFQHSIKSFDETLRLPASYGLGVAYQLSGEWSFALDLYHTEWHRYILEDEDGNKYNLIKARVNQHVDVQPTTQARLGMEYLYIRGRTVYPVRAGILYDPEPRDGKPQDVWGASLGGGWAKGPLLLDAALQLRWAQDTEGEVVADFESQRDLLEYLLLASMIYHLE